MNKLGLRDIPLENISEESLGVNDYVEALTEFITQCETPMTVALQGDWGSGKTSFMRMIDSSIKKNLDKNFKMVWFNSWQYSQFDLQDEMPILLLSHITNELKSDDTFSEKVANSIKNINVASTLKKGLSFGVKLGMVGVAGIAGSGEAAEYISGKKNDGSESLINLATEITKLKDNLEELIQKRIEKNNLDRIIIFIDDLDRLLPEKAIEFLEVFKLFLDIKGCVYVLACDYNVISQGLKKKFGVGTELKGKSFFDKIIQLPFTMPIGHYDTKKYYKNLLESIKITPREEDLDLYRRMGNSSIGFNPRSMKRIFNSLLLLKLVANKKSLFEDEINGARSFEKERIMFGIICLQTAFESVYNYLQNNLNDLDEELFNLLRDESSINSDPKLSKLRRELLIESNDNEDIFSKVSEFMSAFFEALQIESDNSKDSLSEEEIDTLKKLISFSSVTSRESNETINFEEFYQWRSDNREFAKNLLTEIEKRYKNQLRKLDTSFKLYQPRYDTSVYLKAPIQLKNESNLFYLQVEYTEFGVLFSLKSTKKLISIRLKKWVESKLDIYYKDNAKEERIIDFEDNEAIIADLQIDQFANIEDYIENSKEGIFNFLDWLLEDLGNEIEKI